jgi:hypothetical protein
MFRKYSIIRWMCCVVENVDAALPDQALVSPTCVAYSSCYSYRNASIGFNIAAFRAG